MGSQHRNERDMGFWKVKPSKEPRGVKHSFAGLSQLLVSEHDLDFIIVTGHNTAVGGKEQGIPHGYEEFRGGNFSDLEFLPAMISRFAFELFKRCGSCHTIEDISARIVPDIYLKSSDAETHNLVLLGAGNVNCVTEHVFSEYWGNSEHLPVHFMKRDAHDIIVSELSRRQYARELDTEYAILEVVPNFWNESKVIILCCGTDLWGTQAAVCALCRNDITNNQFEPKYPAKVLSVRLSGECIELFKGHKMTNFVAIMKDRLHFEE